MPVSARRTPARATPRLAFGLLATGLALIIAACGGTAATPAAATLTPGESSGPATAAPTTASTATIVTVGAKEYEFTPSTIAVAAGPVRFVVTNSGNDEHEFEIFKGDQVVDEVEGLVPGLTKELPITLAAGEYTFVCKLSGHEQLGMKGTLTVN